MANCITYNCDDLGEYDSSMGSCAARVRKSGASTIYLLECGHEITDPSNATQVNAALEAGLAKEITGVKFGFNDPTPVTSPATTSCGTEEVVDYTRTATLEDYKVTTTNTAFWNTAKKRAYGGLLIMQCATEGLTDQVTWVDAEVTVQAFKKFPNTSSEAQSYTVNFAWKGLDDPLDYDAPTL